MNFWEEPIIGIYKITHRVTGKAYIGQSIDIFRRWKEHISFGENKETWQVIKKALHKHGITEFIFEILEECSKEDLNNREIYWISYFNTFSKDRKNGYNMSRGGEEIYDSSKPCIITIHGVSTEYESATIAGKILGKRRLSLLRCLNAERRWFAGWSGHFVGEAPNIYTRGTHGGHSKKSKPFFLKGILYTCSQKEAIKKSGFPCNQQTLSDCLNSKENWPTGWSGHFQGEEPKECPRLITPGKKKK